MGTYRLPELPGSIINPQHGAIRAPASAVAFAMPLLAKLNWLLGHCMNGLLFQGAWGTTSDVMQTRRIYHRPADDTTQIVVAAIVEQATESEWGLSYITVTPDDGGGTPVTYEHNDTGSSGPFDSDCHWAVWVATADLVDQAFQYHEVEWDNLYVHWFGCWELPRGLLDSASDTMVQLRSGAYDGLETLRRITDSAAAGLPALLQGARDARDQTLRHGGWFVNNNEYWKDTPAKSTWENVADPNMSTSGFGFPHQARRIRSATTSEPYDVRILAQKTGSGTADFRLRSSGTSDVAQFSALPASWAWLSPDGADTLDVDATADDSLIPEVRNDDGTTEIAVAEIEWVKH